MLLPITHGTLLTIVREILHSATTHASVARAPTWRRRRDGDCQREVLVHDLLDKASGVKLGIHRVIGCHVRKAFESVDLERTQTVAEKELVCVLRGEQVQQV